jgi:hypothetical protein
VKIRTVILAGVAASSLALLSACASSATDAQTTGTPTTAPTVAPTPENLTLKVSTPVARSGDATALATGIDPGVNCAISYRTPSGVASTAKGLEPQTASARGSASWLWNIGPSTTPGEGLVTVQCGEETATAPIVIT